MRTIMVSLFHLILVGTLFIGCGGGSRGTGGFSVEGLVNREVPGTPFAGVAVTVQPNGGTSISDEQGQFAVDLTEQVESIDFLFEVDGQMFTASVRDIPPATIVLFVQFTINTETQSVVTNQLELIQDESSNSSGSNSNDSQSQENQENQNSNDHSSSGSNSNTNDEGENENADDSSENEQENQNENAGASSNDNNNSGSSNNDNGNDGEDEEDNSGSGSSNSGSGSSNDDDDSEDEPDDDNSNDNENSRSGSSS